MSMNQLRWFPVWVWPTLALFAIGTVWLRLSIVKTSYQVGQMDKLIANAHETRQDMNLSVARLKSPRRLEALAKKKFGLFPPRGNQIVHLQRVTGESQADAREGGP